jgi:hypothetical protein
MTHPPIYLFFGVCHKIPAIYYSIGIAYTYIHLSWSIDLATHVAENKIK